VTFALLLLLIAQSGVPGLAPELRERPDPDGVPTKVTTKVYLLDLSEINDVKHSFRADVFVAVEWKDPRFALPEEAAARTFPLSDVWHPNLLVLNQKSVSKDLPEVVEVSSDGTVVYKQRFIGTFTIPLNLANFPFDSHRLAISIISAGHQPDEVQFETEPKMVGRAETLTLSGWSIDDGRLRVHPYHVAVVDRNLARFDLEFQIRRGALFYLLRLIGPLLLIVLIGWGTCWIDQSNTGAQLRLGATGFLTLVAYQFAVGGLLPKVSYLTRMDLFVAGTTVIIFLSLAKAVMADYLVSKDKLATVVSINRVFRWVYAVAVVIVTAIAFGL